MNYRATIGMEVHVELDTQSKMFCGCRNGMGQEKEPNKNICPVCTGQPGALPVPNIKAIESVARVGLALNCQIAEESKFDRKNYFYPDLPKGYQISQFDQPICERGWLEFNLMEGGKLVKKQVRITRIHLEEDTGKLMHSSKGETLVDFNRSGVPLMELVTEPDIKSAAEAKKFCEELRLVLRYIGVSPADMEKGQMRCEANISLYKQGEDPLSGTKVELKNLNSFRAVERGVEYEIERQAKILDTGEKVLQETRGWNDAEGKTFAQRSKENANDYRYFPEPDILPFQLKKEEVNLMRERLPELPWEKRLRFDKQFGLKQDSAEILVTDKKLANYFEDVASELEAWMSAEGYKLDEESRKKTYQLAANYILTELTRKMTEKNVAVSDLKITAENFAEFIKIIFEGEINSSAAQTVLEEMFNSGADPSQVIEEKNLTQISDESALETSVQKVIDANIQSVTDYKSGKENAIKFLMGQVMKETQGKANPQMVMEILKKKLA